MTKQPLSLKVRLPQYESPRNRWRKKFHDVDNRLKDIMDSLQGRMGGSKKEQTFERIIPNDRQIYKVTIEKKRPPIQSHGLGHLIIRKYNPDELQAFRKWF